MSRLSTKLLGAILLSSFTLASAARAAVNLDIPDASAPAGANKDIAINTTNSPLGIAGFQFIVKFGTNNSVLQPTGAGVGSLTADWLIMANTTVAGQITVIGFSPSNTPISGTTPGSLCNMRFNVTGSAGQTANLEFTQSTLVDANGGAIAVGTSTGGTFTVQVVNPATVSGTITYGGSQPAGSTCYVGLFTSTDYYGEPVRFTTIPNYPATTAYSINNVAAGTYYLAAFLDVGGDGKIDPLVDPSGAYPSNPLVVAAGSNNPGKNITLQDPNPPATREVPIPLDLTGGQGRIASAPVNMDEAMGVAKFGFVINYDATVMEDTGIGRGSLLPDNWLVVRKNLGPGKVKVTGQSMAGELLGGSGSLAILRFKVKAGAQIGDFTNLTFDDGTNNETNFLQDSHDNILNANYTPGKLTVVQGIAKGDVNGDLAVGVADAIAALRVAAGLPPGVTIYPEADVNNDGAIGVAEAIFALRVAAGLEPDPYDR